MDSEEEISHTIKDCDTVTVASIHISQVDGVTVRSYQEEEDSQVGGLELATKITPNDTS